MLILYLSYLYLFGDYCYCFGNLKSRRTFPLKGYYPFQEMILILASYNCQPFQYSIRQQTTLVAFLCSLLNTLSTESKLYWFTHSPPMRFLSFVKMIRKISHYVGAPSDGKITTHLLLLFQPHGHKRPFSVLF